MSNPFWPSRSAQRAVLEQLSDRYREAAFTAWAEAEALSAQQPADDAQRAEQLNVLEGFAAGEENCYRALRRLQELIREHDGDAG